jgi:hypothetical protein
MLLILTGKRIYPRISVGYGHGFVPRCGQQIWVRVCDEGRGYRYPVLLSTDNLSVAICTPQGRDDRAPVVFEAVRINKKRPNLTIKFNI